MGKGEYEKGEGLEELVEESQASYSPYRSFKDLDCWNACVDVRRWISSLTKTFPKEERFDLVSQMNRAARSTTANIAEGHGRFHYQENIQFCRTSRGSLYELMDHLTVAVDENFISEDVSGEGEILIRKGIALINGYIKYLQKQKDKQVG